MTELPRNPTRDELRDRYEASDDVPADCWRNFGDVNPQPHGGEWVHYDSGGWSLIGTFVAEDVGYPASELDVSEPERAQFVYSNEAHWSDIVTDDGDWTGAMQSTVNSLHGAHESPAGAVVDGRLTWTVVAYLSERREGYPYHDPIHTGDYAEILESVGVDPCPDEL